MWVFCYWISKVARIEKINTYLISVGMAFQMYLDSKTKYSHSFNFAFSCRCEFVGPSSNRSFCLVNLWAKMILKTADIALNATCMYFYIDIVQGFLKSPFPIDFILNRAEVIYFGGYIYMTTWEDFDVWTFFSS